ncbi:MAG: methylmalonyl-CoA epimerase [Chitinophagaceae bacterium]|nr:methylmalonyl-CoA epimerase [Chitinophagaceae bacterium]
MEKIEHIGIAVKDLATANETYRKLLGVAQYKTEVVGSEHVTTSFFLVGTNKIELLESSDPNGVIAKFIERKGEGIHHIAYAVSNIREEMSRLKSEGFVLLNEEPKRGADNKWVCFVHPKNSHGVLVELCEEIREN